MESNVDVPSQRKVQKRTCKLMGNMFSFSIVAEDSQWADHCIDLAIDEIKRIEALLTTFKDDSQTNKINSAAGLRPVVVDREVFNLIQRSIKISELTQGA